jgi:hypothetical protein
VPAANRQTPQPTDAAPGPLAIGVTGHRDVDEEDERLRAVVAGELSRLAAGQAGRPVEVLSSLAEGADRLVAEVAMSRLGAKLVAPLPLAPEEYAKDFASARSRRRFRRLLGRAERWFVAGGAEAGAAGGADGRALRYARAGAYIVEHCSVLVAVWDGRPARGVGGTAQLVEWMLQGAVPEEFSSGGRPPRPREGAVIHVDPETCAVARLPAPSAAGGSGPAAGGAAHG